MPGSQFLITMISMVILTLAVSTGAHSDYKPVDLTKAATSHHGEVFDRAVVIAQFGGGLGFSEWFPTNETTLAGIPFAVPDGVLNCVSGSMVGIETYALPLSHAPTIYFLGTADLSQKRSCDKLEDFNIEVVYSDGSSEEILPVNIITREPKWYDGQVDSGSVKQFPTIQTYGGAGRGSAHLTVYAICPSRPGAVKSLRFNDNDHQGDYVVAAMTESSEKVDWIAKAQVVRTHPAPRPQSKETAKQTRLGIRTLLDITPYCNQSSDQCFDTGYGRGRGHISGLKAFPDAGISTVDGIQFQISNGQLNVISGSTKSLESFVVPVNALAGKVYLLMARNSETSMSYYNPNWADNPYYLSVDIIYSDGDHDTYFPKGVSSGKYALPPVKDDLGLMAYVVEPVAKKKIKAIRINDKLDDSDLVIAGITLDSQPSTAALDRIEPVKLHPMPKETEPKVSHQNGQFLIENAFYRLQCDTASQLKLTNVFNKIAQVECLGSKDNPNLLSVIAVGGVSGKTTEAGVDTSIIGQSTTNNVQTIIKTEKRYDLPDFSVSDVTVTGNVASLTLLPRDGALFQVNVRFTADRSPELKLSTQVLNKSGNNQEFKLINYLTNIVISDLNDTHYFYPPPRGTVDSRPLRIRKLYGGTTYMQLMDAFNPVVGAGVYTRSNDAWGQGKAISFCKSGPNPLVDDAWASYAAGVYLPVPEIKLSNGIYMAFEYWERVLAPNKKSDIPEFVIGFHTGDWHLAFTAYRKWVSTNLPTAKTPEWARKGALFSLAHMSYMGDRYSVRAVDGVDLFLMGSWWNYPNRPETGGRREYFYREDMGGAHGLKQEIAKAHARGVKVAFYLEGLAFPAQFSRGEDGEKFDTICARQLTDGTIEHGSMCPGSVVWQEYLADTCARLIRDTGADGIYLDSICQCPPLPCYKPEHKHRYPNQTWNHDVAVLLSKVRAAIKHENPEAVLYSEAPGGDIATAQLDGAYSYYPDFDAITPNRFDNPKLTALTWYLFPGKRNWSLVESLIDPSQNLQAFFNGDMIFTQSSIGVAQSSLSPYRKIPAASDVALVKIMKQYTSLLSSTQSVPMVTSLIKGVYVNKFADEDQLMYNILNSNFITARGELVEVSAPDVYVDLMTGRRGVVTKRNSKYYLSGRIGPKEVACFVRQQHTKEKNP